MKNKETIKIIIITTIICAIILLIMCSTNIINLNKSNLNIAENIDEGETVYKPNVPVTSAGMIPVKYDGTNWVITTKDDTDWYDYENGKPAYIMLNDGTYQSELVANMTGKKLAKENKNETISETELGSIYVWVPRFAYKTTGEIKYIPAQMQLEKAWIVPDMFVYSQENEKKPDFSLTGVWLEKDVDTSYSGKLSTMQKENGIYGFLANTKTRRITSNDTTAMQKYIEATTPLDELETPTNTNRIILQIINQKLAEPIKAKIEYNKIEQRIEIRVTYTKNGIKQILDENGDNMELTENDGVIYTDTSNIGLATGTYNFTVIDNENNKRELSIDITVDSLFKVAYINGTDNMNIDTTYAKTQETKTSAENSLLNQIRATDTTKTFSRAIQDKNNATTAIGEKTRSNDDKQIHLWGKYNVESNREYYLEQNSTYKNCKIRRQWGRYYFVNLYSDYHFNSSTGKISVGAYDWYDTNSSLPRTAYAVDYEISSNGYMSSNSTAENISYVEIDKRPYEVDSDENEMYNVKVYEITVKNRLVYQQGTFIEYLIGEDNKYTNNAKNGSYWYVRNNLVPKYTIYKYDENLKLKSAYDIDTKVLTTVPINIANKGNNKVKLTLNTYGSNYKTYISNDNTNWQEVTGITSKTPKELAVDGWDKLYIKIETNTSRIDNIDVAYYKD